MARAAQVREMFGRIVPRYDVVNRLMTGGQDVGWRRVAAQAARPEGGVALDIATGTADLAFDLLRLGARRVVAADFCVPMLSAAQRKLPVSEPRGIQLMAADALALPYADATFDCVTSGFLLRNVVDLPLCLREMHRVLRPGGRAVSLDLTPIPAGPLAPLAGFYFHRVVPLLGRLVSGDGAAYRYLPSSLAGFPTADCLTDLFREVGFGQVTYRRFGFGAIAIHVATKNE
ncbi:MAG: ubiE [Chloroflexi bacterium]|nr:ubiE [Chloroflexota bacterium]